MANIYFDYNPPVITEPSVLVAEFSTGVAHDPGRLRLLLSPNPAQHAVTIVAGEERITRWALFTSDARMVRSSSAAGGMAMIDIEDLAPGTYIVQAESMSGTRYQAVLIKQ
ncbi:MAG: T9SS type A sorting domain-containing protein [Flavobacteriales bacterium]